jgi:hypothetical protein
MAPAADVESPVQPEPQPVFGAVAAAPELSEQPRQAPSVVEDHVAVMREAAATAAVAGDYWSAIERYGAVLAALRATTGRGE